MRKLSATIILFIFFAACYAQGDSIIIEGQLTGNCDIPRFTIRAFDVVNQQQYFAPVNSFGSFNIKIPYGGVRQYTLSGGKLRYDFLATPAQSSYRFTITCQDDGDFKVKLEDSKENEAFGLLSKIEKHLLDDCIDIVAKNKNEDSIRLALENLFTAHAYNLKQIAHSYPLTFTASVLAPVCNMATQLPREHYLDSLVSRTLRNEVWNNTAAYQTDLPLDFITIINALSAKKSDEEKSALIGDFLSASPSDRDAAKHFQEALYQDLFYELEETRLFALCLWAEQHPDKIVNDVLKAKLQRMRKVLPGNKFINETLKDTAGQPRPLSDIVASHQFTLLLFWSPDCSHCRAEMPHLISFYDTYHDKGVEIYAICMEGVEPDKWKNFISKNGLGWINVMQDEDSHINAASDYMLSFTPTLVLIDKQGNILSRFGSLEWVEKKMNEAGFK